MECFTSRLIRSSPLHPLQYSSAAENKLIFQLILRVQLFKSFLVKMSEVNGIFSLNVCVYVFFL
jgi:hypothetical protein